MPRESTAFHYWVEPQLSVFLGFTCEDFDSDDDENIRASGDRLVSRTITIGLFPFFPLKFRWVYWRFKDRTLIGKDDLQQERQERRNEFVEHMEMRLRDKARREHEEDGT